MVDRKGWWPFWCHDITKTTQVFTLRLLIVTLAGTAPQTCLFSSENEGSKYHIASSDSTAVEVSDAATVVPDISGYRCTTATPIRTTLTINLLYPHVVFL